MTSLKIKTAWNVLLLISGAIGGIIMADLGHAADEYVLPPNVTEGYKKAPRTDKKEPGEFIQSGKWKGYTPPPMPEK